MSITFKGWWSEDEKEDSPEPWETFEVALIGHEAGDMVDSSYPDYNVEDVLKLSGYKLTLEKL